MDLYRIDSGGGAPFFEGTQADARRAVKDEGGAWAAVESPDRKEARIAWLNELCAEAFRMGARSMARLAAPSPEDAVMDPKPGPVPPAMQPRSAVSEVARIEDPDVDRICDHIGQSSGYALARYASCVAVRFNALAAKH